MPFQGENTMVGGDVAVAYMDEYLGHVEDYNLTARYGKKDDQTGTYWSLMKQQRYLWQTRFDAHHS